MSDKTVYLSEGGLGRPATRGLRVGDKLSLSEGKAALYIDRGWATESKPSEDALAAAPASLAPPPRRARMPFDGQAAPEPRKARPVAKRRRRAVKKTPPVSPAEA